jgi:hypothetical protein
MFAQQYSTLFSVVIPDSVSTFLLLLLSSPTAHAQVCESTVNLTDTGSSEEADCNMPCVLAGPVISMSSNPPWRISEASVKSCRAGPTEGDAALILVDISGVGTRTAMPASRIFVRMELSAVPMTVCSHSKSILAAKNGTGMRGKSYQYLPRWHDAARVCKTPASDGLGDHQGLPAPVAGRLTLLCKLHSEVRGHKSSRRTTCYTS